MRDFRELIKNGMLTFSDESLIIIVEILEKGGFTLPRWIVDVMSAVCIVKIMLLNGVDHASRSRFLVVLMTHQAVPITVRRDFLSARSILALRAFID